MVIKEQFTTQRCSVGWKADGEQTYTAGEREKYLESSAAKGKKKIIIEITLFSKPDASLKCGIMPIADRKTVGTVLFAYTEMLFQGQGCNILPFCCIVKIKCFQLCK